MGIVTLTLIYERVDDGANTVCEVHQYNIDTVATETVSGTNYRTGTLTHKSISKTLPVNGENRYTTNYS